MSVCSEGRSVLNAYEFETVQRMLMDPGIPDERWSEWHLLMSGFLVWSLGVGLWEQVTWLI